MAQLRQVLQMPGFGFVQLLRIAKADLDGRIAIAIWRLDLGDRAGASLNGRDRAHDASLVEDLGHAELAAQQPFGVRLAHSLISMFTPAGRLRRISASTVLEVGSRMSIRRLWVRISNCSRESLSMKGERRTVNFSMRVGSGTGPDTTAPVRWAVSTIWLADWSMILWSWALRRMRIRCLGMALFEDLADDAGAHGAPALADGEPQALLHGHRHDQLDLHRHVVPRHHHLRPLRQLRLARHIRRPDVELRPVALEERRVPPPFVLAQHVHLPLEVRVRLHTARLGQHLPALDLVPLHPPQQAAH